MNYSVLGGPSIAWWHLVRNAWEASSRGDVSKALGLYDEADSYLNGPRLNGSLSVLRHNRGQGSGSVLPVPATETSVISMFLHGDDPPVLESGGHLPQSITEKFIEAFLACDVMDLHVGNIDQPRPHVMVLSSGRCGTRSVYELFRDSNLMPYHTYWFTVGAFERWEMICRFHAGNFEGVCPSTLWAATRAAEWLGEKSMIGANHTDTIFAPVFAAIHPKSKFIYLHRNDADVTRSFIDKEQWGDGGGHFRPLAYEVRDNKIHLGLIDVTVTQGVWHHLSLTDSFCRAFGNVMGDRFTEISSDKLFRQDRDEIAKLLEFTGSDIDIEFAVEHFATKINEKAHKAA